MKKKRVCVATYTLNLIRLLIIILSIIVFYCHRLSLKSCVVYPHQTIIFFSFFTTILDNPRQFTIILFSCFYAAIIFGIYFTPNSCL